MGFRQKLSQKWGREFASVNLSFDPREFYLLIFTNSGQNIKEVSNVWQTKEVSKAGGGQMTLGEIDGLWNCPGCQLRLLDLGKFW